MVLSWSSVNLRAMSYDFYCILYGTVFRKGRFAFWIEKHFTVLAFHPIGKLFSLHQPLTTNHS